MAAGGLAATTTRWDYTYDDRGRLATATKNSGTATTYTYDPNGNRTGPTVAHYDLQDRMMDLGGVARTYTNNGSLATRGSEAFTYDLSGNLRKWVSGGTTIEYLIDGQNRRVGKKRNGTLETIWLYDDQLRLAAQLNGAGHVRQVFYYSGQSRTPELVFQPDATPAVTGGGRWFRLVSDLNGSLRLVLDISGTTPTVRQRADYDPWGVVTGEWVDTTGGFERVPFGFAAGLLDTDTGLVRFGARDYEPAAGRWTTKDPVRFRGGANLYLYSTADPVNVIDPSGEQGYRGDFRPTPGVEYCLRFAPGGALRTLCCRVMCKKDFGDDFDDWQRCMIWCDRPPLQCPAGTDCDPGPESPQCGGGK